ncbi:uncharacterized protein LOC119458291 isoform X1 [Dermacentor silvarum]|uniref:uncharacterized protein LOC119458291 isoform X1 n=1 Tax=Dermacentor silvarum TaxID=543639 RepID=UPI00189A3B52|nr:uncharacterized protein LOC119458291 isoform X1 [Dermacentor silvarum]
MAGKQLFASFVLLVSMTLVNGVLKSGPRIWRTLDIRKFVCTRERIWTYSTNTSEYTRCKMDQETSMSNGSIFFRRTYFYDEQWHWIAKSLEGVFPKHQKNLMHIRNKDHLFIAKEKIVYMNEKYGCAVIKVTQELLGQLPHYDLRVWNRFVTQRPHEKCVKHFEKLAPMGKVIYGPRCQEITKIK